MKLRGQIYPKYTDSLPYECRGIGQVCDMATGRVGEPVPMGPRNLFVEKTVTILLMLYYIQ